MCKKQDKQQKQIEVTYPRYLTNQPTGKDLYEGKSQEKLVDALALHIRETDGGEAPVFARLIGLEGKWGSGKSNVIKLLADRLKANYIFFTFDAWGNQEDLQRRSILELLTKDLLVKEKLTGKTTMRVMKPEGEGKVMEIPCTWKEKLDSLLSRKSYTRDITVPSVQNTTKWFVLSLLAVGLIVAYLAVDKTNMWWLNAIIGLSPLMIFTIGMFLTRSSWSRMFAMYNTEGKSDTTSYVISEQEPSVREFKEWLTELSKGIPEGERIVLVFDNMDRLPSDKVRQFWSLIQTFFADANEGYKNVWCIVPYDEEHLASVFSDDSAEHSTLLKGYLGKTFPLVYRVPEPIVADYKNIFDNLYRSAFGTTVGSDYVELIGRCYRHAHPEPNVRDMIAFVNSNVQLAKQWGETVSPVSRAVYQLKTDEIIRYPLLPDKSKPDGEKKQVTTDEYILSMEYFNDFNLILSGKVDRISMRREIAALVYGIAPDSVEQIIAKRYIRNCLSGNDKNAKLSRYVDNPHFMLLLSEDVQTMLPTDNIRAAALIEEIDASKLSEKDAEILSNIWRHFASQAVQSIVPVKEYTHHEHVIFSHAQPALAERCAKNFCQRLIENKEVSGDQLYEQLTKLFDDDFAKEYDKSAICPAISIEAKRFADYVVKAGKNYAQYPIKTSPEELNNIINQSLVKDFPYLEVLKQLKDDKTYKVAEVGKYATEQMSQRKASAKTANNLITVQRVFYDKFQSTIDSDYINTLWQEAKTEDGKVAYAEVYALRAIDSTEQMPHEEADIKTFLSKMLFYTSTTDLIKKLLAHTSHIYLVQTVKRMIEEKIHDANPDYSEFIVKWQTIVTITGISRESMVQFADAWGMKAISQTENQKNYFALLDSVEWIDVLFAAKTSVANLLIKKLGAELKQRTVTDFLQANTFTHANTNWNKALQKLIRTDYLNPDDFGTLNQLAVTLIDTIAKNGATTDEVWNALLAKVKFSQISTQVSEIRDKILNGQSGYVMTPAKFLQLHIWLEQTQINTADHCSDAANRILAKVITDEASQKVILENGDYYKPIIANTVETASELHAILKKNLAEQADSDFAKYVAGIVNYEEAKETKNE